MKHLQWFPGHMTQAMRMMEENVKLVDGIILVLDARAPRASLNKKLEKVFGNKKILYVLNKCDLVEKSDCLKTVTSFKQEGKETVAISAMDKKSVDLLYDKIFTMLKEKVERNKEKGVFKPMRVMVAGIPNTGKSTIINALVGNKKATTGDKAGVTRGKQWVRIRELELLDTPGTMPPSFENQTLATHLAFLGSMNDANLDFSDLAFELIKFLQENYPTLLAEKYGIEDTSEETIALFDKICVRRGFLLKRGEYDYERCAKAVIDDFRKGRIGKIILD